MFMDDDEEWARVKMGHFTDADEKVIRGVMGPWFKWSKSSPRPQRRKHRNTSNNRVSSSVGRARTIGLGYEQYSGQEVVVKARLCPKALESSKTLFRYVARLRPQDKRDCIYGTVPLWDEFGVPVSTSEALEIHETWKLKEDADNLSKPARDYLANGDMKGFHAMPGRDRLSNVQVKHYVLSIEEDGSEPHVEKSFQAAVWATIDEVFTAQGHKVLWAMHKGHTEHLHAHVLIKNFSKFDRCLDTDIHGNFLHGLRDVYACHLQNTGLNYQATRRIDRRRLRERILAGDEPLKQDVPPWRSKDGLRDRYEQLRIWGGLFGDRALDNLDWLEAVRILVGEAIKDRRGKEKMAIAAYVMRKSLDQDPKQKPSFVKRMLNIGLRKTGNDDVPEEYLELYEVMRSMYHDPVDALVSWVHMVGDGSHRNESGKAKYPNRALANWTLRHRPELFGRVKSAAFEVAANPQLKKLLRKQTLPLPEHFPVANDQANPFHEYRLKKQIKGSRSGVIAQLKYLCERFEPGSWWAEVVRKAADQAQRIAVGQAFPYSIETLQTEDQGAEAVVVPVKSIYQKVPSGDGDAPPIPANNNAQEKGQEAARTNDHKEKSRKFGRSR